MVRHCQVCKNADYLSPSLSFHKFPTDSERRKIWVSLLGWEKDDCGIKHLYVCSNHFNSSDIVTNRNGLKYLKAGANPLPSHSAFQFISDSSDSSAHSSVYNSPPKKLSGNTEVTSVIEEIEYPIEPGISSSSSSTASASETKDEILKLSLIEQNTQNLRNKRNATAKKIKRKSNNSSNTKTYCRLCLKHAPKNQLVCLGDNHNLNYPSRSDQFKRNKILQTEMYIRMINTLMPDFNHNLVHNAVMCTNCSTKLQMASDFVEECMKTQKLIENYREFYCPTEEMVLCEEVAQNKSMLDIQVIKIKQNKPSKQVYVWTPKRKKCVENYDQELNDVDQELNDVDQELNDVKPIDIEETNITIKNEEIDNNVESFPIDRCKIKEENVYIDTNPVISEITSIKIESDLKTEPTETIQAISSCRSIKTTYCLS